MNRMKTLTTSIVAVLIIFGVVVAQTRSRVRPRPTSASTAAPASTRRAVTVNLTQGEPVKGLFVRGDADTILVEVAGNHLTLKTYQVASLVFAPDETATTTTASAGAAAKPSPEAAKNATPTPDPSLPAARKAHAALSKLASASQIGLPYAQYGSLLIEVKAAVDEATAGLPENGLKSELLQAMDAYTDAGKAWSAMQANGALLIAAEPGASLVNKYSLKPVANALGQADRLQLDTTLSSIWAAATAHLDNVKGLIR